MTDRQDLIFDALADPTRRRVVEALLSGPQTPGELSRQLSASPQALSRHLRTLRHSGLVQTSGFDEDARIRVYALAPTALEPLKNWLDRAEAMWTAQLSAFKSFAEDHG